MYDILNEWIVIINDGLWTYVIIALLLSVGIYFTLRTGFVQFRNVGEMFRLFGDGIGGGGKNSVSSFQAFCVATASRVGTGNLAGVATAVALGGPGAVFWMWLIALVGSASAFIESTLAQIYKEKGSHSFIGGPAFYMQKGMGQRWMGVLFAIIIMITYGLVFNSVQANTITLALNEVYGLDRWSMGGILTFLTFLTIFGGIRRVAKLSGIIVPVMAIAYIAVALWVLGINVTSIPSLFINIFAHAFGFEQFAAGTFGAIVMHGVRRGLFSNEAGMGSAPNAAATANVTHPVKQGLIQALSVFTDTLIICSCTAFIILLSGEAVDGSVKGIQLTQLALTNELGVLGGQFIAVAIFLFAFSSIVGNYSYCETNLYFITKRPICVFLYRLGVCLMVFWGAEAQLDIVWNVADLFMAIMAIINVVAIVWLSPIAFKALRDYKNQKRRGVSSPEFHRSSISELGEEVTEWE